MITQITPTFAYDGMGILQPVSIHNPLYDLQSGSWPQGGSSFSSAQIANPIQQALDQLNPVKQVESYLQENQINYIVGFIGIVLLIIGIGALAKPAIETAAKVA